MSSRVTLPEIEAIVSNACPARDVRGKRLLVIVPDGTRTGPVDLVFGALHRQLGDQAEALDVLVALGTHQPMTESAICRRLGIPEPERQTKFRQVRFFNHAWNDPSALVRVGTLKAVEIEELTGGLFAMDVPVEVNRLLFEYDRVLIVGPVFPHEVVGFSGGNKYLFPGVSGPGILNFFHWLGAVVTNAAIIGVKNTPVRRVIDRAGAMVGVEKVCFCLVVDGEDLAGLFAGTPERAWQEASELSRALHIVYKERAFHTILSCAPAMYDELWTAGKCMYKLEPVLADGGELIIYAPHLSVVSAAHGEHIDAIGYHCRDYFQKQWDRFKHLPWGVLAHSTHVRGAGVYDEQSGERCRAAVTLASQIPAEACRTLNLGYRDPATICLEDYAGREDQGVLLVRKAGEMLYRLKGQAGS